MKSRAEAATAFMENIAADNSHGYSQQNRWGPDYDCSSLVITAWERAGVPVRSRGASYTGNMKPVFLACGFENVTNSVNLYNGDGLKRGDILLNELNHTAMYVGNHQVVHARSSEGNSIPGDQSGNEIRVQGYWNYPWDCVLRWPEQEEDDTPSEDDKPDEDKFAYEVALGDGLKNPSDKVRLWQALMLCWGISVGPDGADGEFWHNTLDATTTFQYMNNLEVDGIANRDDWEVAITIIK